MTKTKVKKHQENYSGCELGRGVIKDNFLAAVVRSRLYKQQIVTAKKGKGTYQRTQKHKRQEPYLMAV
jgi:alternative ribosome-rescue factor